MYVMDRKYVSDPNDNQTMLTKNLSPAVRKRPPFCSTEKKCDQLQKLLTFLVKKKINPFDM